MLKERTTFHTFVCYGRLDALFKFIFFPVLIYIKQGLSLFNKKKSFIDTFTINITCPVHISTGATEQNNIVIRFPEYCLQRSLIKYIYFFAIRQLQISGVVTAQIIGGGDMI